MATNPPPCLGCGRPLFDRRAGTKVHNDRCRAKAKERGTKGPHPGVDAGEGPGHRGSDSYGAMDRCRGGYGVVTALPKSLLDSIWATVDGDQAEAERLVQRWRRVLPEMEAATERIRQQVREYVCRCALAPSSSRRTVTAGAATAGGSRAYDRARVVRALRHRAGLRLALHGFRRPAARLPVPARPPPRPSPSWLLALAGTATPAQVGTPRTSSRWRRR